MVKTKTLLQKLEEQLRFETLLFEISSNFVNVPDDRIEEAMTGAQRQICEVLGLHRSVLWQIKNEKFVEMILSHVQESSESRLPASPFDANALFPWIFNRLRKREVVAISRISELPPEAVLDREMLVRFGVKSAIILPLMEGDELVGVLSFGRLDDEILWQPQVVSRLEHIAQIFINVIVRKKTREKLDFRLRLETVLAEISTRFINLTADRIDNEIENAQEQICKCLDLDISSLWQWSDESHNNYVLTHAYIAPGGPQRPEWLEAKEFFPWAIRKAFQGETVVARSEGLPSEAERDLETLRSLMIQTLVNIPLVVGGEPLIGVLTFNNFKNDDIPSETTLKQLQLIAEIFANALVRKQRETERRLLENQLKERLTEIEKLKEELELENIYLKEEIELQSVHEEIVGRSQAMKRVLAQVEQVARTDTTVLIEGETGTGKELLARALHKTSNRKDRPFVTVNCASLPPTLIESELFGREKGAFTGAMTRMMGRFEVANGATLFLDEIGELPLEAQAKLLRVLEQGSFERLGSTKTICVNVRIIAATNRDLAGEVAAGKFRKDLYFRLNVFPIFLPPLNKRTEDIPQLVWAFVREFEKMIGKRINHISRKHIERLQQYSWPGNVRELRNIIERAMIVCKGRTLDIQPPHGFVNENSIDLNMENAERIHIENVLQQTHWRLSGPGGAAEILGMKRTTLQSRIKKLGIHRSSR